MGAITGAVDVVEAVEPKAPAVAVVVFAVMFSLSAFVIGPAMSGSGSPIRRHPRNAPAGHSGHHG